MVAVPVPKALRNSAAAIDDVLDRPIEFSPSHWQRQLERFSVRAEVVAELRGSEAGADLPRITRQELVAYVAERGIQDRDDRIDAFLAAMIWGGGPPRRRDRRGGDSRTPWRIATALSSRRFGDPDEHLVASLRALREGDLESAYLAATRLHWVSGSFATKWLWLIGEVESIEPRPLIWDSVTVAWLNRHSPALASRRASPARTKTDAGLYRDYVVSLDAWAAELGVAGGSPKIEAFIFASQQAA